MTMPGLVASLKEFLHVFRIDSGSCDAIQE